jgi:dTDP-4-amino-4,6-dideoxygalactose transaminase
MNSTGKIPFLDLVTLHKELQKELLAVFQSALETAGFVGGPFVDGFERDFANFCDTKQAIGVNSGTDALRFALSAAGVREGDIALTTPLTFIATTEAISQVGARPDFVDIDLDSYAISPQKLREYLETRCTIDSASGKAIHRELRKPVTAVVPVHLYGHTADMDQINEIANRYKLIVIEDACQAHGAEYFSKKENRWRKAGSMGRAAAFSFYPGKNLGACGEGGAVTTNDEELARKVRVVRDHGQAKKYYHDVEGYNGRLDAIQAGILRVKLPHLNNWNQQRRECAERYDKLLAPLSGSVTMPAAQSWCKPVYHIYCIRTQFRNELQKHLEDAGIGTGIHYPIPVHLQKAYASFNWKRGDFPVTEQACDQILSLPMFPGLQAEQQWRVAEEVAQFASVRSAV